jgi:hypothetical protein
MLYEWTVLSKEEYKEIAWMVKESFSRIQSLLPILSLHPSGV